MCGIAGIITSAPAQDHRWLATARDTLTHRGPDDAGEWWSTDCRVGLAHRRLSIIDLSFAGHQPMQDARAELTIVFNGEIYNFADLRDELIAQGHSFRSQSDTEVILAAYREWGTDCLKRFNGMFAFALHDARQQSLFLARDRVGEKPLFYRQLGGELRFASELKALLADPTLPRRVDPDSLDCYLAMGYIPGERCILQGFNKLQPAHALLFDLITGQSRVWRYWQLPELAPDAGGSNEAALLDELETLLEDAVRRQMVADVPVGVLLSGGVDSSLITAMAVRHSPQVRTFSIGFSGHGQFDERQHARLVASHFKTDHIELTAEPSTADLLPMLMRQFDEPLVDSSMFPTWLVSHLVRQHCTVALGGDGGDELFGGYGHYSRLLSLQAKANRIPLIGRRLIAALAAGTLPLGFAGTNVRTWLMALATDLRYGLPLIASYFDALTRRSLMRGHEGYPLTAELIWNERVPAQADLLQRATRMDFNNYLAEDILVKVDRASMLNSLEVRAPFLDHRLIEFAFNRVPSTLKLSAGDRKIMLKRLATRILPAAFNKRRKQGFSIPMAEWLKAGPFRELFWDTLLSQNCLFDGHTVMHLLKGQDRGRNNGERLFALVQFELWRQAYGVGL